MVCKLLILGRKQFHSDRLLGRAFSLLTPTAAPCSAPLPDARRSVAVFDRRTRSSCSITPGSAIIRELTNFDPPRGVRLYAAWNAHGFGYRSTIHGAEPPAGLRGWLAAPECTQPPAPPQAESAARR